MIVLRNKEFSWQEDMIKNGYLKVPSITLPKVISDYYKSGLNKDFYELCKLVGDYYPFPVFGQEQKNDYLSAFSDDGEGLIISVWVDEKGNLFKKTGLFFTSFKPMSNEEFKEFLIEPLREDEFGEEYKDDPNYNKIKNLELKMKRKIENL